MRPVAPVFFKELYQMAQSRRLAIMKWLFLGCLFVGFLLCAQEGSRGYNQDEFGVILFGAVSFLCAGAVLLFAPIMTASVISGEREANSLGLLFLTRLNAWSIVQEKGLSRMVLLFYITGLTFPLLAAGLLYGGVEARQVWSAIANMIAMGMLTSGVAILSSALWSKFSSAIAMTYLVLLVWYLIVPLVVGGVTQDVYLVAMISPFVSVWMSFETFFGGIWATAVDRTWLWNLGIGFGAYLFCTAMAALLVRRMALSDTAHVTAETRGFGVAVKRFGYVLAHANPFLIFHRQRLMNYNPVEWQYTRLTPGSARAGLYNLANAFGLIVVGLLFFWMVRYMLRGGWRSGELGLALVGFYGLAILSAIFVGLMVSRLVHSLSVRRERPSMGVRVLAALSFVVIGIQIWTGVTGATGQVFSELTLRFGKQSLSTTFFPEAVSAYVMMLVALLVMGGLCIAWYCTDDDGFRRERMDRIWMLTNFLNAMALFGVSFWVFSVMSGSYVNDDLFYSLFIIIYGGVILFAVILGGSTFTREKQIGTFPILLSTRMKGSQIVNGVLLGCWRTMLPMLGLALSIVLVGALLDPDEFSFFRGLVSAVIHVGFALVLSVFLALIRPNLIQTLVITIGILAFLYVGLPLFGELADVDAYLVSPGWLVGAGLSQDAFEDEAGWWWLGNFILYIPAALLMYVYMVGRFDAIVGRQ